MSSHRSGNLAVAAITATLLFAYLLFSATAANTAAARESLAQGFADVPPAVDDIQLTALEKPGTDGNAALAVVYARDQPLPDSIPLDVAGKTVKLARDPKDPQRFTANINFDFDAFVKEQEARQKLAERKPALPVFDGREVVGEGRFVFLDPAKLREQIKGHAIIRIPHDIFLDPPLLTSPAHSLMVTDPLVVEDPTRTFDACTNAGNPDGAWTFNKLMTDMANTPLTGVQPGDFVENWLKTWQTTAVVNSFPITQRPNINSLVLSTWPRDINGRLDLRRSPMRLLAIVNRLDLRNNAVYGGGRAGEGRFVFGVMRRLSGGGCAQMRFTVILEYGLPLRGCPAIRSFAQQWGDLDAFALGSATYNGALQDITDQFTRANASPSRPNGSAINQIRSNENALNPTWELREFNVLPSHQLALVTAKQTPHTSFNTNNPSITALADYVNANQAAVIAEVHNVPLTFAGSPFLTGASRNTQTVWKHDAIVDNDARHHLSLNTCDSCHGAETQTGNFLHVAPRNPGVASQLSRFLVGTGGTVSSPTTFTMNDPVDGVTPRTYGDLLRRQSDLASLQSSACLSGGLLAELHAFHLTSLAISTE